MLRPHLEQHTPRATNVDLGDHIAFRTVLLVTGAGIQDYHPRGAVVIDTLSVSETRELADTGRINDVTGFNTPKSNRRWVSSMYVDCDSFTL